MAEALDVHVYGLYIDSDGDAGVVLLGESPTAHRVLPIVIGIAEARALAIGLSGLDPPRPMTHDLVVRTVEAAHGQIERIDIVALEGGTFFAELEMALGDRLVRLDVRPSDGIGVAVRVGAPIGVDRRLFERVSVEVGGSSDNELDEAEMNRIMADFQEFLEHAEPNDFRWEGDASDGDEPEPPS